VLKQKSTKFSRNASKCRCLRFYKAIVLRQPRSYFSLRNLECMITIRPTRQKWKRLD